MDDELRQRLETASGRAAEHRRALAAGEHDAWLGEWLKGAALRRDTRAIDLMDGITIDGQPCGPTDPSEQVGEGFRRAVAAGDLDANTLLLEAWRDGLREGVLA